MAFLAPITVFALAFCACFVATGQTVRSTMFASRSIRWMERHLRNLLRICSQSAAIERALSISAVSASSALVRTRLAKAGFDFSMTETCSVVAAGCVISACIGAVFSASVCGAPVGAAVYAAVLCASTSHAQRKHVQALSAEMPAVFRSLAVSLGSGLTLSQAIAYVGSREDSVTAPAFAQCSLRILCGDPYDEALSALVDELRTPGIELLSSALAISHRTGSPLQSLFMRSANLVERAGELERLLVVKTAQVRLSVRIVCLLPALLVGVLLMISPDFQAGIATPTGIVSIALAACMDCAAVLIVRRLSRGIA